MKPTAAASAMDERQRGTSSRDCAPASTARGPDGATGAATAAAKVSKDERRRRPRPRSGMIPQRSGGRRREGERSGPSSSFSPRRSRRRRRVDSARPTAVGGGGTWPFLAIAAAMIRLLLPDGAGAVPGPLLAATTTEGRRQQQQRGRGRPTPSVYEDDPPWGGMAARRGGGIAAAPRHPRGDRPPDHPMGGRRRLQGEAADGATLPPPPATDGGGESQRLRRDILENYDRGSYPWEYAWAQSGWVPPSSSSDNATMSDANGNSINATDGTDVVRRGLPVEIGINFHRVYFVDVVTSDVDLIVWFRQSWVDPRLSWNPDDYSGLTAVWFYVGDGVGAGETSEIWTPDVELWNMGVSLKESLTDAYATVDYTGAVFWSRPGHLKPVCRFSGLDSFPFDTLGCTMEIGSWSKSGLYLRPTRMGGTGYSVGGSETAGESYSEFSLQDVNCREHVYPPYIGLQEQDWPVLLYDVSFSRSWQPYTRGYLTLQIVLNLAGFACFWMPIQSGERVALAITAMLAAVASELVIAARLPSAAEVTWFQAFSLASLTFASLCLFESVAVVYFYYYTHADLVPDWCRWIASKLRRHFWKGGGVDAKEDRAGLRNAASAVALGRRTGLEFSGAPSRCGASQLQSSGIISELRSIDEDDDDDGGENGDDEESSDKSNNGRDECGGETSFHTGASTTSSNGSANGGSRSNAASRKGDGDRGDRLRSPPRQRTEPRSPGRPPSQLAGTGVAVSPSPARRRGRMSRSNSEARDADDFHDSTDRENNRRWQRVAARIDEGARVVVPLAYAIVVGVLLNRVSYT